MQVYKGWFSHLIIWQLQMLQFRQTQLVHSHLQQLSLDLVSTKHPFFNPSNLGPSQKTQSHSPL